MLVSYRNHAVPLLRLGDICDECKARYSHTYTLNLLQIDDVNSMQDMGFRAICDDRSHMLEEDEDDPAGSRGFNFVDIIDWF